MKIRRIINKVDCRMKEEILGRTPGIQALWSCAGAVQAAGRVQVLTWWQPQTSSDPPRVRTDPAIKLKQPREQRPFRRPRPLVVAGLQEDVEEGAAGDHGTRSGSVEVGPGYRLQHLQDRLQSAPSGA